MTMMRYGWILIALLVAACGDSQPTAAVCTRPDSGSPCSEPTTASRIEGYEEQWLVIVRKTITGPEGYYVGSEHCTLTHTTCVVEECAYVKTADGWVLLTDYDTTLLGPGEDTAERAIEECSRRFDA